MRKVRTLVMLSVLALAAALVAGFQPAEAKDGVKAAPNGIAFPKNYSDWRLIAISQREDNKTMRAILGNDKAIAAVRARNTNPWPNGAVLAKIVWKNIRHDAWQSAIVPGEFVHVEFMFKDAEKYASTGGWGFARWKGTGLVPHGNGPDFVNECFGCHAPVKDNDYVFTKPAIIP